MGEGSCGKAPLTKIYLKALPSPPRTPLFSWWGTEKKQHHTSELVYSSFMSEWAQTGTLPDVLFLPVLN